jgi:hypothetical protein
VHHANNVIVERPMGTASQIGRFGWVACLLVAGCMTTAPLDNPGNVRIGAEEIENPVLVSPGQPTALAYQEVFEKTVEILSTYFELLPPNPYDGRIVSKPRIMPGFEQFWKPGNPDARSRLLSTFQTTRQTATAEIRAGERGGYLVYIVVEKELEDLSRPILSKAGAAVFQEAQSVDRQLEVVGPDTEADSSWFKIGRNYALEQEILRRIRRCR